MPHPEPPQEASDSYPLLITSMASWGSSYHGLVRRPAGPAERILLLKIPKKKTSPLQKAKTSEENEAEPQEEKPLILLLLATPPVGACFAR